MIKELKINTNDSVSLKEQFVYFGLHLTRKTTLPDGGIFHDQFLAIVKLRELIPNNIKIYVKEHPSMFYKSTWGYRGRSPIFYNLLNNISNVQILNNEYKSVELIRASIFTATISGTVGFESAVIGKEALIFEYWYRGCPNTVTWSETIDYSSLINKVSDKDKLLNFKTKLKNESVLGNHNSTTELRFKNFVSENFIEDFNNLQLQVL